MHLILAISLIISVSTQAQSDLVSEVAQLNQAISYNPDGKAWLNKIKVKKSKWLAEGKLPGDAKLENAIKELEDRATVISELQACLEKHGVGMTEVFNKVTAGTNEYTKTVAFLCGSQISSLNQIARLQDSSGKALAQSMIDLAMMELNSSYLDKFLKMKIASEPQLENDIEHLYINICEQKASENLFNGFCKQENITQSISWIKDRVSESKGVYSNTKFIAEKLNNSIQRVRNVYQQIPLKYPTRGLPYRNGKEGSAEYSAYVRTYSEEVAGEYGSLLLSDPIKDAVGELVFSDKIDHLPERAHLSFTDLKMDDARKEELIKKSAVNSASTFYFQAVTLNYKMASTNDDVNQKLNFLIGTHPHLFGKYLRANPNLVAPMCESLVEIEKNRVEKEKVLEFFKEVSSKTGLAFGGAALISCVSSFFIPIGAPLTVPACAYFGTAAIGAGVMGGVTGVLNLGNSQSQIDEIVNQWRAGNPSYKPEDYLKVRGEISVAISDIVESGLISAAGSTRFLSYISRLGKEGIEGVKTISGLSKVPGNAEAISNLRRVHPQQDVDDLVATMHSLKSKDAEAMLKLINSLDPSDYRLYELIGKTKASMKTCPI